jgi:hypothetical protein
MQEAELLELIRFADPGVGLSFRGCHLDHDTSVRKETRIQGCGTVVRWMRNGAA